MRLRNVAQFMGLLLFINTLSHSHLSRFSTACLLTPNGESSEVHSTRGGARVGKRKKRRRIPAWTSAALPETWGVAEAFPPRRARVE